jgi:hypothetical protein
MQILKLSLLTQKRNVAENGKWRKRKKGRKENRNVKQVKVRSCIDFHSLCHLIHYSVKEKKPEKT